MFLRRDWLLIAVTFVSIAVGVFFPRFGMPFAGWPKYSMMAILFLSFLPLRWADISSTLRHNAFRITALALTRLVLLPVAVFALFQMFAPRFALAALLLSGISTGVVAPFFAGLLRIDTAFVLVIVVITSVVVPFTLPVMVKLLAGQELVISLTAMIRLLAMVVFIPLILAAAGRSWIPALTDRLRRSRYPLTLALFALTNLGIFSAYAGFFREQPAVIIDALLAALTLALLYFGFGILYARKQSVQDRLAAVLCFGIMNNVLVLVFSAEFFGPLEATVAAVYTIPFYSLIVPLRLYQGWAASRLQSSGRKSS